VDHINREICATQQSRSHNTLLHQAKKTIAEPITSVLLPVAASLCPQYHHTIHNTRNQRTDTLKIHEHIDQIRTTKARRNKVAIPEMIGVANGLVIMAEEGPNIWHFNSPLPARELPLLADIAEDAR
jgi:hypothetical protein